MALTFGALSGNGIGGLFTGGLNLTGSSSESSGIAASGTEFPGPFLSRFIQFGSPFFSALSIPVPSYQSLFGNQIPLIVPQQPSWWTFSSFPGAGVSFPEGFTLPGFAQEEPLFGVAEIRDAYRFTDPEKMEDVPRIFRAAGLDIDKKYPLSVLAEAGIKAPGLSGRSRGSWAAAIGYLEDLSTLSGMGVSPAQPTLSFAPNVPSMPLDLQRALEKGTAKGLSFNTETGEWEETEGTPELIFHEGTGQYFYKGIPISASQAAQFLTYGPPKLPEEVERLFSEGRAIGLSYDPRTGTWVDVTGQPELVYWGPTDQYFYKGVPVDKAQVAAMLGRPEMVAPPPSPQSEAAKELLSRMMEEPDLGFIWNFPRWERPPLTAAQAEPPPEFTPPRVEAPEIPLLSLENYVQPFVLERLTPPQVEPVPEGTDLLRARVVPTTYPPPQVPPVGVVPEPPRAPEMPIPQIQLPFSADELAQASIAAEVQPALGMLAQQYEVESQRLMSRLAASGMEGSAAAAQATKDLRREFLDRATNLFVGATGRAMERVYSLIYNLLTKNADLYRDSLRQMANLEFAAEQARVQEAMGLIDAEQRRRMENAAMQERARQLLAQQFYQSQLATYDTLARAVEQEYRRRQFNAEQIRFAEDRNQERSLDMQRAMNEIGLRWGIAQQDVLRRNAELNLNADLASAGFDQEAKTLFYRTLADISVSNAAELNRLIAITGDQDLRAFLGELEAFSRASGINVDAILGLAAHNRDLLRLLYGENFRQNDFALRVFEDEMQRTLEITRAAVDAGGFSIRRQRSESESGPFFF